MFYNLGWREYKLICTRSVTLTSVSISLSLITCCSNFDRKAFLIQSNSNLI